jgi:hypothetical protein
MSCAKIIVVKKGKSFQLHTEAYGLCGNRLFHGDTKKNKWPFARDDWNAYKTRQAADDACKKLQAYLDRDTPAKP